MKNVIVDAPAKVNLFLDITGKRQDGYHFLDSVMQSVDICDTVTISQISGHGLYISCSRPGVPLDDKNLAHVAARRFMQMFDLSVSGALSIDIEKRIPMQAGLGGGSSDAAAVLLGLDAMFRVDAGMEALCRIGETIGADVPFCLRGGACRVTGIGEKLEQVKPLTDCYLLVAKPEAGACTARVYEVFDTLTDVPRTHPDPFLKGMQTGDLDTIAKYAHNVLEFACEVPEVVLLKERMCEAGALCAVMSGSGSSVFGIFDDKTQAKRCMRKLYELSQSVFLTQPRRQGVTIRRMG